LESNYRLKIERKEAIECTRVMMPTVKIAVRTYRVRAEVNKVSPEHKIQANKNKV